MTASNTTVEVQDLPERVSGWLEALRAAVRESPSRALFEVQGFDLVDLLISPLYVSSLNALRHGGDRTSRGAASQTARLRQWLYGVKTSAQRQAWRWRSRKPESATILFWPRDVTHLRAELPVMAALRANGVRAELLACNQNTCRIAREMGANPAFTWAAWPGVLRRAMRDAARQAHALAQLRAIPWPSYPADDAANESLRSAVLQTLVHFVPLAHEAVANARAAIDAIRPRLIVVGHDVTVEGRAVCHVATRRGVKTAVLMHGSLHKEPMQYRHCADAMLVHGPIHRDVLIACGKDPARIRVVGAPELDTVPRQSSVMNAQLRERLGFQPNQPWVLVATSGPGHRISHEHHQMVVEQLVRLSNSLPDVRFVVKLHAKDKTEYYDQAASAQGGSRLQVIPHGAPGFPRDIFAWLAGCPLLLTGASTMAIEAMLMDVPVVTIDLCEETHGVDFIEAGATTHVIHGEALAPAVRKLLEQHAASPEVQRGVQSYLGQAFLARDGGSARRAATELCSLIAAGEIREVKAPR